MILTESKMGLINRKGNIVLKLLIVVALVLLFLSIDIPRQMWNEKKERMELGQKRMGIMYYMELLFKQETDKFSGSLKEVYDFAMGYDSLEVNPPSFQTEYLTIDSTQLRIDYEQPELVTNLFVSYAKGGSMVEKLDKDSLKKSQTAFKGSNELFITLDMRDKELGLEPATLHLTSESPINIISNVKTAKDIYWDFFGNSKIHIEKINPENEIQHVNLARYIMPDMSDTTPYLCPSTLEEFVVNFNLTAKVNMNIEFTRGTELDTTILKDVNLAPITSNENIQNFMIDKIGQKSLNSVGDFVREHEVDGDSTYSNETAQDSLFIAFFHEKLKEFGKEPFTDKDSKNIKSIDIEREKNFADDRQFALFFTSRVPSKLIEEVKKPEVLEQLSLINFGMKTEIVDVDTLSLKISSPINEESVFRGYERSALRSKGVFGIEDDENHGFIDDGEKSWGDAGE